MISDERLFEQKHCHLITDNRLDQVLAFERKDIIFVFNFSPDKSYTDYAINVNAGKYRIILSTDHSDFGGFGNVREDIEYFSKQSGGISSSHYIQLYIPCRTAMALKRFIARSIR